MAQKLACIPILFTTFALAVCSDAIAQTKLELKFKTGDKYQVEVVNKMNSTAVVNGREIASTVTQTVNALHEVLAVDAQGKGKLKQTIKRVRMTMDLPNLPGQKIEFDSDEPEKTKGSPFEMFTKSAANLHGSEFTMTLDPQGNYTDVIVPDDLVRKMNKTPFGQQIGGGNSKEQLKGMITGGGINLPEKSLSVGDTWKNESSMSTPAGTVTSKYIYAYAGKNEKGLHKLTAKVDIAFEPNPDRPAGQMKMTSEGGTGTFLFDASLGRVVSSSLKNKTNMEMTIMGRTIKQSVDTETTMSTAAPKAATSNKP